MKIYVSHMKMSFSILTSIIFLFKYEDSFGTSIIWDLWIYYSNVNIINFYKRIKNKGILRRKINNFRRA